MSVFDSQTKSHSVQCIPQQAKNLRAISCIDNITHKSKSMFRLKAFLTYVNLSFLDSESSA